VTNPQAVDQAVAEITRNEGHVDVLIHAAGIEISRKLLTKPPEEFRNTVAVKASGLFYLIKALQKHNCLPKAVVGFGSVAGRYGNTGQTDYAAASDLLGKLVMRLHQEHPSIQTLAIDWGAWAEVGMASRGHIPELMKMAGIEMLPPEVAAPKVRQELIAGTQGELLLAGSLGKPSIFKKLTRP
jgi:NAD(P)-dependent dehydrogenase (short-subunit alcohol dehydrogenase family)